MIRGFSKLLAVLFLLFPLVAAAEQERWTGGNGYMCVVRSGEGPAEQKVALRWSPDPGGTKREEKILDQDITELGKLLCQMSKAGDWNIEYGNVRVPWGSDLTLFLSQGSASFQFGTDVGDQIDIQWDQVTKLYKAIQREQQAITANKKAAKPASEKKGE